MKNEQNGTTRRSVLAAALSLPAMAFTAAGATLRGATPKAQMPTVKQSELRAIVELNNQIEVLAASIRMRLEAGAPLERGKLGVNTWGEMSLEELSPIGKNDYASNFAGLTVEPVEEIKRTLAQYPQFNSRPSWGWSWV